jgi:hypothetical protein
MRPLAKMMPELDRMDRPWTLRLQKLPNLALGAALSFLDSSMSTTPVQVSESKAIESGSTG